jgi:RNA polymerase sigma factor (sigma-70 family)
MCSVITKNVALDMMRRRKFESTYFDNSDYLDSSLPDLENDVLQDVMHHERTEVIEKAMSLLTEDERALMYMRYGLLLKPKDIANLMNSSSAFIRKKTLYCRNKLARILEVEGYGEDIK